jgi:Flp pilus assembly protein TadG
MRFGRGLIGSLSRWLRSPRGNVAIIAGLAMPCLVGFCGMGADVGYWYYRQRVVQGAADIAAYNAAIALQNGSSKSAATTGASSDAATNGWNSSKGSITVNTPPVSGTHETNNSVEVILSENESRFFTNLFSSSTVAVSTRAVATWNTAGSACILALDKSASEALKFWGNTSEILAGCDIMSDSLNSDSLAVGGSAAVTTPCAIAAGGISATTGLVLTSCGKAQQDANPAPDPYASLPAPTISSTCASTTGNLSPGTYCGGLDIKDTRTLSPGTYVIDGGTFSMNANANITGTGVTFYLTNGASIAFNGNATMNLSAPTTGTYAGVAFFGDRSMAMATQKINGDSSSVVTGAIYFPSQQLEMDGNFSGQNGCMQIIADEIYLTGNSHFGVNCAAYGMNSVPIPGGVSLVE